MPFAVVGEKLYQGNRVIADEATHGAAVLHAQDRAKSAAGGTVSVAPTVFAAVALDFADADRYEEIVDPAVALGDALAAAVADGKGGAELADIATAPLAAKPGRVALLKKADHNLTLNGGGACLAGDYFGRWEEGGGVLAVTAAELTKKFKLIAAEKKTAAVPAPPKKAAADEKE